MSPIIPRRAFVLSAIAGGALLAASLVSAGPHHAHHRPGPEVHDPLEVHEWGTFTVMQGSDGMVLEGMQHEEEKLPGFVASLTGSSPSPFRSHGVASRDVPVRKVRKKMETPVIYFHTKTRRRVRVRVGFERGIVNQYYPEPISVTPKANPTSQIDLSRLRKSSIEWDLELFPQGDTSGLRIPHVKPGELYGYAREAKSAYVRARTPKGPQDEQFVFYRGLGAVVPKITIGAGVKGWNELDNRTKHSIPAAFAVQMKGKQGRFISLGKVAAGKRVNADLCVPYRSKEVVIDQLAKHVKRVLVAQGLHEDEALSMVRTWSKGWFASEGTRILYVVPPAFVDRVLPLQISPKPDKTVRVFIGRIEFMTPEEENHVKKILVDLSGASIRPTSPRLGQLASLGRFIEPKVRRVMAMSRDPRIKRTGAEVLRVMQQAKKRGRLALRR